MAKCPKCGRKLTVFNVSQFCPGCGVNLRFYDFEKTFFREAKYAELSNAVVHVKFKRLVAAFIGSKLAIMRLVAMLLPVVALLLPAANAELRIPFSGNNFSLSGLGIYNMFSDGSLNYIMSMKSSALCGTAFSAFFNAMIGYAVIAVFAVFVLLTSILCFISIKNMQKITAVMSALGIAACVADGVLVMKVANASDAVLNISGSFGIFVAMAMFAAALVVNILLSVRGIPVTYGEGMVEREEIYNKLKKHEVTLDELPQPVVETEATRKIDEEIRKEEENLRKRKAEAEGKEDKDEQSEKED